MDKHGLILERDCSHCGGVDRFAPADETDQCGTCGVEAHPVSRWVCDQKHAEPRCAVAACFLGGAQGVSTARPERVLLPPSEDDWGCILEMFELGDGPIGTGPRHCVWLHKLRAGGFRWKCSCGVERGHQELDAVLLAEARGHFEQPWDPPAVPLGHPVAIWNDRASGKPPPTVDDLQQLAREFAEDEADVTPIRPRGPAIEAVHICGICGETFRIAPDDPHWSTGEGPLCPTELPQPPEPHLRSVP